MRVKDLLQSKSFLLPENFAGKGTSSHDIGSTHIRGYEVNIRKCRVKTLKDFPGPGTNPKTMSTDEFFWICMKIDASLNHIRNITGLDNMPRLVDLNLSINSIRFIKGLNSLTSLKRLNLSHNRIESLDGLNNLKNLEFLDVSANKVSSIENVSHLSKLTVFNISGNQLKSTNGLSSSMEKLDYLNLSKNHISECSEVAALPNLRRLDLSQNQISDSVMMVKIVASLSPTYSGDGDTDATGLSTKQDLQDERKYLEDINLTDNPITQKMTAKVEDHDDSRSKPEGPKTTDDDSTGSRAVQGTQLKKNRSKGNVGVEIDDLKYLQQYRNFKLSIISVGTRIKVFDGEEVLRETKTRMEHIKRNEDLSELIEETTKCYIERIELEAKKKYSYLELLQEQQKIIESNFNQYRNQVEKEMQDCVRYLHDMSGSENKKKEIDKITPEALLEWKQKLDKEIERQQNDVEATIIQKEELKDAMKDDAFLGVMSKDKLKELSFTNPQLWMEWKGRELKMKQETAAQAYLSKKPSSRTFSLQGKTSLESNSLTTNHFVTQLVSQNLSNRLTSFYEVYNPDKIDKVGAIVEKYVEDEDELHRALLNTYGETIPEPSFRIQLARFFMVNDPDRWHTRHSFDEFLENFRKNEKLISESLLKTYGETLHFSPEFE